ncbi:MAG TPA: hypothetical protein VEB21_02125 [Terriglobales bacterium]|nr:hypothetical protein [Terriglobales bacterium]
MSAPAAAKVTAAIYQMAAGNLSNVKSVGAGVLERKVDFGPDTASILGARAMCW